MNHKKFWQAIYAVVIVASLGFGITLGARQFSVAPPLVVAQLLPSPKVLPAFSLQNHRGESSDATMFLGHWSLVFFGFTSCPDYCPMELQKLAKLLNAMAVGDELQVVFVSVDPERDEQKKLASYVQFFHPQIVGLRGSNVELASLAKFFGAAYDRSAILDSKVLRIPAGIDMPVAAGSQYQVNHSTRVFIVNPKGEFIGSFASPFTESEMLLDVKSLVSR